MWSSFHPEHPLIHLPRQTIWSSLDFYIPDISNDIFDEMFHVMTQNIVISY